METERIAEGLWRWSAGHPEWKPGEGWDPEVACVYYEDPEAVVLIDPLVPAGEADVFWRALDRDVERLSLPVCVLTTSAWHERSAAEVVARYGGTRHAPAGVETIQATPQEAVFWIPAHAAIVVGDALLGGPDDLRLQPASWADGAYSEFIDAIARLRSLPIELILPSHGTAVVIGAAEALACAVAQAQSSLATDR